MSRLGAAAVQSARVSKHARGERAGSPHFPLHASARQMPTRFWRGVRGREEGREAVQHYTTVDAVANFAKPSTRCKRGDSEKSAAPLFNGWSCYFKNNLKACSTEPRWSVVSRRGTINRRRGCTWKALKEYTSPCQSHEVLFY